MLIILFYFNKFLKTNCCQNYAMQTSLMTFHLALRTFKRHLSVCEQLRKKMQPKALLCLAEGAEELESITVVDVLRRGDVKVTIGGLNGSNPIKCRCETMICPDKSLEEAAKEGPYSVIVLPGGLIGAKILSESPLVGQLLKAQESSNGFIAAICAAPTALKKHNIGKGKNVTSYPAMAEDMKRGDSYIYHDDIPVVVDGKLITSRGPGTAFIFALTILENLTTKENAKQIADAMLYKY